MFKYYIYAYKKIAGRIDQVEATIDNLEATIDSLIKSGYVISHINIAGLLWNIIIEK